MGTYLQHLYEQVPDHRIKVVFLEDLYADPSETYKAVLRFLGVDDSHKPHFTIYNSGKNWRNPSIRHSVRYLRKIKTKLEIHTNFGIQTALKAAGRTPAQKQELSPSFQTELKHYFDDEIQKIAHLTGRDLSH